MVVKDMRPLPRTSFELEPTFGQVSFYRENGYLSVDRLTTDEEIEWLTELAEHIFDPANADDDGAPVDRSTRTDDAGPRDRRPDVTQAFFPEGTYPQLLRTQYNRNARRVAAALLGVDISLVSSWSHMIRKGPDGCEVPWHQDEAYWDVEFEYQAVGSWLALHDVPANMGAMQFIPGSHHHGVVEHRPLDGDVERHLLTVDVDVSRAVTCPLRAGGATFHHPRALHNTTPNTTDRARVAFPSKFQTAPVRRAEPAHRRWVDEWRAATGREAATGYQADGRLIPL